MKKLLLICLTILVLNSGRLKSCIMTFNPEDIVLNTEEEKQITVFVELEHRKCDIPLEDTYYDQKGIKIIKKGDWVKVKRLLYKQELTVKPENTDGILRIWRDCEEKGISEVCKTCSGCGACLVK